MERLVLGLKYKTKKSDDIDHTNEFKEGLEWLLITQEGLIQGKAKGAPKRLKYDVSAGGLYVTYMPEIPDFNPLDEGQLDQQLKRDHPDVDGMLTITLIRRKDNFLERKYYELCDKLIQTYRDIAFVYQPPQELTRSA